MFSVGMETCGEKNELGDGQGDTGCLLDFSALRSRGKQSLTGCTGREKEKKGNKNYDPTEGKCLVVLLPPSLGRRMFKQCSQTSVGLGISVYPAKMRADPVDLGWPGTLHFFFCFY